MSGQDLETAESNITSWEVEDGAVGLVDDYGHAVPIRRSSAGCSLKLRGYLCGMPFSFGLSRAPDELVSSPGENVMALLEALEQALHPKKIRERAAEKVARVAKETELKELEKRAAELRKELNLPAVVPMPPLSFMGKKIDP